MSFYHEVTPVTKAPLGRLPRERAAGVLQAARAIDAGDTRRKADIDKGASVAEFWTRKYK